jgi:hypothetical protein
VQRDVTNRGLASDPAENLFTLCRGDFAEACRSLGKTERAAVGVVTGFYIPKATPPAAETDGPLGALFLARALVPAGVGVSIITDPSCLKAVRAGLAVCGLEDEVPLLEVPEAAAGTAGLDYWRAFAASADLTHLVALERVGPSHTPATVRRHPAARDGDAGQFERDVAAEHHDRCHNMRGLDITEWTRPAHLLFEGAHADADGPTTIGIGDGGNEIGMGKLPWRVIRLNVARGGLIACRVPAHYLLTCGVSNWGAYALAAGVLAVRGVRPAADLFDIERERELLRLMVDEGPLVDGVTGRQERSVDGLAFEQYAEVLPRLGSLLARAERP